MYSNQIKKSKFCKSGCQMKSPQPLNIIKQFFNFYQKFHSQDHREVPDGPNGETFNRSCNKNLFYFIQIKQ